MIKGINEQNIWKRRFFDIISLECKIGGKVQNADHGLTFRADTIYTRPLSFSSDSHLFFRFGKNMSTHEDDRPEMRALHPSSMKYQFLEDFDWWANLVIMMMDLYHKGCMMMIRIIQIHHCIFGESEVQINGKVLGSQYGNKVSFLECIILPLKEDLNLIVINIYLLQNIRLFAKFWQYVTPCMSYIYICQ